MCNWFLKRKKQSISKNSEQQQKSSLYHQSLYNRIDSLFYLIQSLNFGTVACNFLNISICTKNSDQYCKWSLYGKPYLICKYYSTYQTQNYNKSERINHLINWQNNLHFLLHSHPPPLPNLHRNQNNCYRC